jgi:hypothetical protein
VTREEIVAHLRDVCANDNRLNKYCHEKAFEQIRELVADHNAGGLMVDEVMEDLDKGVKTHDWHEPWDSLYWTIFAHQSNILWTEALGGMSV